MSYKTARFGWLPDLPDQRDHLFSVPIPTLRALPSSVDLTKKCPPVYDQGQIGSCTGNAIAGAVQFDRMRQGLADFIPSRLFIYWNERVMEHTTQSDAGARIRDGIKSVAKVGDCPETQWPYDPAPPETNEMLFKQPPASIFKAAQPYKAVEYQRVTQSLSQLKGCLASGFPIVIGFTVYTSFMSQQVAKTGEVPMPSPTEQVEGGHAVLVVGYDDATARFRLRNSWGTSWGKHGYFTMPYAYLIDRQLASDFWTIRLVH
jgi:C1A family cysteine protease